MRVKSNTSIQWSCKMSYQQCNTCLTFKSAYKKIKHITCNKLMGLRNSAMLSRCRDHPNKTASEVKGTLGMQFPIHCFASKYLTFPLSIWKQLNSTHFTPTLWKWGTFMGTLQCLRILQCHSSSAWFSAKWSHRKASANITSYYPTQNPLKAEMSHCSMKQRFRFPTASSAQFFALATQLLESCLAALYSKNTITCPCPPKAYCRHHWLVTNLNLRQDSSKKIKKARIGDICTRKALTSTVISWALDSLTNRQYNHSFLNCWLFPLWKKKLQTTNAAKNSVHPCFCWIKDSDRRTSPRKLTFHRPIGFVTHAPKSEPWKHTNKLAKKKSDGFRSQKIQQSCCFSCSWQRRQRAEWGHCVRLLSTQGLHLLGWHVLNTNIWEGEK